MKAVILAGGFGTRLKSVVSDVPKPMARIAGKPFLEHQLLFLREFGIKDIIIAVHYMANTIKSYFGIGHRWQMNITYAEEDVPLGTAGAIKNAEKYIDNTFLVINGDTYSNIDLHKFVDFHKAKRSLVSMAVTESSNPSHYGNVSLQEDKVVEYGEKILKEKSLINAGFYLFEPRIFDYIKPNRNVSLEKEIFPLLAEEGALWGYKFSGYFMDMGRPETYEKFKQDYLNAVTLRENHKVKDAMSRITQTGIDIILITNIHGKLLGVLNDRLIKKYILKGGSIEDSVSRAMVTDPEVGTTLESKEKRDEKLRSGLRHLPIVDENGIFKDLEFYAEKIRTESFPIVRGRAPLRISFAGGGTDLQDFFEKHSGIVISSTIDKYCYATIVKRADSKVIINSDIEKELMIDLNSSARYNGSCDLIKAIINVMKPSFGFELYLHNDIPPGRGLGSSATLSVLLIKLLSHLMETNYDDYKIAEIAYKVEREELKIKGGWQDQYAAVTGGFNFMEFDKEKRIIHPLRLKEETINELNEHLLLCFVGKSHDSGDQHFHQENKLKQDEEEIVKIQNEHKKIAISIKDSLLTNDLENIGKLLHESWENKKKLSGEISNPNIDNLYEIGLKNGSHGGRLLGAGGGGYILFFYEPRKRNQLVRALEDAGGETINFNFEFDGTKVWTVKNKF